MGNRYLIIADDFTGANDTGIQMKKRGIDVDVLLNSKLNSNSVVLDTESRNLSKEESFDKVTQLSSEIFSNFQFDIVYKKVDSTLRGNIAYELKAIADIYKPDKIIFAPAFPKLGRTTQKGLQYLHGTALMNTELTKDPLSPIVTDNLRDILAQTFMEEIKYHSVSDLVSDVHDIGDAYLHIYDIQTDQDILNLSKYLLSQKYKILYVGSAGLAEGIFSLLHPVKPVLGVVGSVSQVSINQLNYAKSECIDIISLNPKDIFDMSTREKYLNLVISKLNQGLDVVITSCNDRKDYDDTLALAENQFISKAKAAELVKDYLSYIVEKVLSNCTISGLFLTGGDIAAAIVGRIGASGCKIGREISPGIVLSNIIHPVYSNIKIITKAGAFGGEKDLFISLNKLKEK